MKALRRIVLSSCVALGLATPSLAETEVVTILNYEFVHVHIAEPIDSPWWFNSFAFGQSCVVSYAAALEKVALKEGVVIARVLQRTKGECPKGGLVFMRETEWERLVKIEKHFAQLRAEQEELARKAKEALAEIKRK